MSYVVMVEHIPPPGCGTLWAAEVLHAGPELALSVMDDGMLLTVSKMHQHMRPLRDLGALQAWWRLPRPYPVLRTKGYNEGAMLHNCGLWRVQESQ
jgi:hypothetical protein